MEGMTLERAKDLAARVRDEKRYAEQRYHESGEAEADARIRAMLDAEEEMARNDADAIDCILNALATSQARVAELEGQRDKIVQVWSDACLWWIQPSAMLGEREWQVMTTRGLLSRHSTLDEAIRSAHQQEAPDA